MPLSYPFTLYIALSLLKPFTYWDELGHVTFVRGSQFGTDQAFCLLAVVNGPQDGNGSLHVEGSQVFQSGEKKRVWNHSERREISLAF